ncbi:hypothetical protein BH11PSE2_BH11PSE2_14200 [soil metagenome]
MARSSFVVTLIGFAATLALSACSGPGLDDGETASTATAAIQPPPPPTPPVPPQPVGRARVETTELLGGPPPGRPDPVAPVFFRMSPIPNPEDLSPADRAAIYGDKARPARIARSRQPNRPAVATTAEVPPAASAVSTPKPKARRTVTPAAPVVKAAPAPVAKAAPAPVAKAAPAPVAPKLVLPIKPSTVAEAPRSVLPDAKTVKPVPSLAAAKASPLSKADQLGFALAADITSGAKLVVPDEVRNGKKGLVSLTLPANFADRVKTEAATLGLTKEASKTDIRASLTAQGYDITPNASQVDRLKPGVGPIFYWEVKPQTGAKTPLKAQVGGELKGTAKPVIFSIASLSEIVPLEADDEAATAPAGSGFKLPDIAGWFKNKTGAPATVDLPIFGKSPVSTIVITAVVLLAILLLAAISRGADRRRREAERRRKFRTMSDAASRPETFDEPKRAHAPVHEPAI